MSDLIQCPSCQAGFPAEEAKSPPPVALPDKQGVYMQPPEVSARLEASTVKVCYIAASPAKTHSREPNGWSLVLELDASEAVALECRPLESAGNTALFCTSVPFVLADDNKLMGYLWSWKLAVRRGSTVQAWVNDLAENGLTRYQLIHGYGLLWWFDCALTYLGNKFVDREEVGTAKSLIRHVWEEDGSSISQQKTPLGKGKWLGHGGLCLAAALSQKLGRSPRGTMIRGVIDVVIS